MFEKLKTKITKDQQTIRSAAYNKYMSRFSLNIKSIKTKLLAPKLLASKLLAPKLLALGAVILGTGILSSASALTLEGKSADSWPKNARLGLFTVLPNGKTALELSSVALGSGNFSLELSKVLPSEKSLNTLAPDSITWAGVVGIVKLSSAAKVVELKLLVYSDLNSNAKRDEDEALLEPVLQMGRANLIFLYTDTALQIDADKGFSIKLPKGYSAISIESGKAVKGIVLDKIIGLQLEKP